MKKNNPSAVSALFLLSMLVFSCSPFDSDRFNPEEHSFEGEGSTFFFPMVITPNGDGLNDRYQMIISTPEGQLPDSVTDFSLHIRKD
jgi:hypothetical protein